MDEADNCTWYMARWRHKTLPLAVKGVMGLKLAADAVPEDNHLIQFLDPLPAEQVKIRHRADKEWFECGASFNRVWVVKEPLVKNMVEEAGYNPDLTHGARVERRHSWDHYYLAELDCPLVVVQDSGNSDEYERAILGGQPFFVLGRLDRFDDDGEVAKWYGRDSRLLKNGWSVRALAKAVVDVGAGSDSREKKLFYVWLTPGRVKAQGRRRKKAVRDESRRLKEKAKTWGLVFKDGDHLNVKRGNVRIGRKLERAGDVSDAEYAADRRAERLVQSYLGDVFNLCAWRRLAGKPVGLGVLKRKLLAGGAPLSDIAFPTDADMREAIGQLRASKDRWALTENGKWRLCGAKHLHHAARDIRWDRAAGDKRRARVRTRFGTIKPATFRRLIAAVRELPLPDGEWFRTVVGETVYRNRRKNIRRYAKEVDAFLKKQAAQED